MQPIYPQTTIKSRCSNFFLEFQMPKQFKIPVQRIKKIESRIEFHLKHIKRQLKRMNLKRKMDIELDTLKKETLMLIINENEFLNSIPLFKEYLKCNSGSIKLQNAAEIEQDLIRVVRGLKKSEIITEQVEEYNDDVDELEPEIEKKNRKGQRQRRKEWELKFGTDAKHLKLPPKQKEENLHPSWEAKRKEKLKMAMEPKATKIVFE